MPTSDDPPEWTPSPHALHVTRWENPPRGEGPTTIVLSHPTAPFIRDLDTGDWSALRGCAREYLKAANERANLGLPPRWLRDLEPDEPQAVDDDPHRESGASPREGDRGPKRFEWAPLESEEPTARYTSFWFERSLEGEGRIDRTLVLLMAEQLDGVFMGSEFGLRVVGHVLGDRETELRITGLSAVLPFGPYLSRLEEEEDVAFNWLDNRSPMARLLFRRLNLQEQSISYRGFRLGKDDQGPLLECRGVGLDMTDADTGSRGTPQEFIALARMEDGTVVVRPLSKVPLVADAEAGKASVFPRDPASQGGLQGLRKRRPTRGEALNSYRKRETISSGVDAVLEVPKSPSARAARSLFQVWQSRFVIGDDPAGGVKKVRLPKTGRNDLVPRIVSNDLAAISAFYNFRELFARFSRYKIDPHRYFRLAQLPLKVAYRSGVRPGPGKDGLTINARVLPEGWDPQDLGPQPGKPRLEVHLALADLSRRERAEWNRRDRSQAQYLGIAADPRWIWHEIGHILLMASIGELEFRFAHSPGDALAAIVADPDSELAEEDATARGATFPWVFLTRRHDRCVGKGWSWSGSQHRALRQLPDAKRLRPKGYWSEQILSSSLFRLYRCLGGDTSRAGAPDREARQFAADYTLYLIIRGINLLGSSLMVPANYPDQLVSALIDADIGTARFLGDPPRTRIGGCAHKVIRWAFEAQGLYPADPGANTNAPGLPEPVDIYIDDRRPREEVLPSCAVTHRPGGYVPVSLHWPADGAGFAGLEWLAAPGAIDWQNNQVRVRVGNRGRALAQGVSVRVWQRAYADGDPVPLWNDGTWTEITPAPGAQNVAPDSSVEFGPFGFAPPAGQHFLVLAEATCAADRANSDPCDPPTGLPCSQQPTPLIDLVAGDNNLGLTLVPQPPEPPG